MKLTVGDLKSIKSGTSETFKVGHPKALSTAKSLASQTWRDNPELGVKFSCSCNYKTLEITVSAISLEIPVEA